jgi:molecular chaperone DnaK
VLVGAVGASVGVGIPGGGLKKMIDRNLPLPVERGYTIATSISGQRDVELHLFQGERPEAFENDFVGVAVIGPLPSAPKGDLRIAVTLSLDASGELAVRARDVAAGKALPVTLDRGRSLHAARRALLPRT